MFEKQSWQHGCQVTPPPPVLHDLYDSWMIGRDSIPGNHACGHISFSSILHVCPPSGSCGSHLDFVLGFVPFKLPKSNESNFEMAFGFLSFRWPSDKKKRNAANIRTFFMANKKPFLRHGTHESITFGSLIFIFCHGSWRPSVKVPQCKTEK